MKKNAFFKFWCGTMKFETDAYQKKIETVEKVFIELKRIRQYLRESPVTLLRSSINIRQFRIHIRCRSLFADNSGAGMQLRG